MCSENKGADQLCGYSAQLICVFVVAYAKRRFSHDAVICENAAVSQYDCLTVRRDEICSFN